jgi:hypothetical protein
VKKPESKKPESKKPESKKLKSKKPPRKLVVYSAEPSPPAPDDQIVASNLSLHELFAQQTTAMLERAELSDEQKQSILIAMSCPCCGAGGFSFTAKLKQAS